jgi:hypothetical protein
MTPDKFKLINALVAEYEYLCHDDFDPDEDPTPQEYHEMLIEMSYDELIEEASLDESFTLEDYLGTWL